MDIKRYESMLLTARNKFMILPEILEEYKKELKEEFIKAVILSENNLITSEGGDDSFYDGVACMCEEACEIIERS